MNSKCHNCNGSGNCPNCKGTGSMKKLNPHPAPWDVDEHTGEVPCSFCKGKKCCTECNGTGSVTRPQK